MFFCIVYLYVFSYSVTMPVEDIEGNPAGHAENVKGNNSRRERKYICKCIYILQGLYEYTDPGRFTPFVVQPRTVHPFIKVFFTPSDDSPLPQFHPRTFHPPESSPPGMFTPRTVHSPDGSPPEMFTPRNISHFEGALKLCSKQIK